MAEMAMGASCLTMKGQKHIRRSFSTMIARDLAPTALGAQFE
jgi:hypothetical protein